MRGELAHCAEQRLEVKAVVQPVPVQLELATVDSHHHRIEHRDQRDHELIRASQLSPQRQGDAVGAFASEPTRLNERRQRTSDFSNRSGVGVKVHAPKNAVREARGGQRDSSGLSLSEGCPGVS